MEEIRARIQGYGWKETPVRGVFHREERRLIFTFFEDNYELSLFDSVGLSAMFKVHKRKVYIMEQLVRDWCQ